MTQPTRPGQRVGQRPQTVGEQPKPAQQQQPEQPDQRASNDPSQTGSVTSYGAGMVAPQQQRRDQYASGGQGSPSPRDVWQLAVWAVTPTTDEQELRERRNEVREVMRRMVDQLTGEGQENPQSGTEGNYES